jgi:hypothetical protein
MQQPPPAPPAVLDTMHAAFLARALHVVAELGVADLLAGGPRSCTDLASKLNVQPVPLHQVLRTVASIGLLRTEDDHATGPDQRYSLTESGRSLQDGHPSATRDLILTMQGTTVRNCMAVLSERIATGRTGPWIAYGMTFFDYLAQHPDEAESFNRMMIATGAAEPPAVASAYDFSWAHDIVDVGGGIGTFLLAVLDEYPHLGGVVFDLPEVVEHARRRIAEAGVAHRCYVTAGNFLESVPPGADAYLLSRVLHDWDDDLCVHILRTCAEAMTDRSRLLIVEKVLPDNDEPHLGKMLDLVMVTLTSGRERTAAEYRNLLSRAGLRLNRVVPTESACSVVEVVLAD